MEGQVRRYFIGLVGFGFTSVVASAGALTALAAVAVCLAVVCRPQIAKGFLNSRTRRPNHRHRTPRTIRTRPLVGERPDDLPLVPDEPSLILEVSSG
jgi:hypothetical protein